MPTKSARAAALAFALILVPAAAAKLHILRRGALRWQVPAGAPLTFVLDEPFPGTRTAPPATPWSERWFPTPDERRAANGSAGWRATLRPLPGDDGMEVVLAAGPEAPTRLVADRRGRLRKGALPPGLEWLGALLELPEGDVAAGSTWSPAAPLGPPPPGAERARRIPYGQARVMAFEEDASDEDDRRCVTVSFDLFERWEPAPGASPLPIRHLRATGRFLASRGRWGSIGGCVEHLGVGGPAPRLVSVTFAPAAEEPSPQDAALVRRLWLGEHLTVPARDFVRLAALSRQVSRAELLRFLSAAKKALGPRVAVPLLYDTARIPVPDGGTVLIERTESQAALGLVRLDLLELIEALLRGEQVEASDGELVHAKAVADRVTMSLRGIDRFFGVRGLPLGNCAPAASGQAWVGFDLGR